LENCRNRVGGCFGGTAKPVSRDVSSTSAKPGVATCSTSRQSPSTFAIQAPSPSLSYLADIDASQPLVFLEVPTNSTPSCLDARSGSPAAQQWPKHPGCPSPPHGRPAGPPTPPQGLPPPHGRRAPCHRNAAAWCIGTRLALVQTISLPPRHPCTCTPQTKNWRNLHRVATTHS